MAFKAYIIEDLIDEKEDDINQRIEPIPSGAEAVDITELRWNGTSVVDANDVSNFFIDENGLKRTLNFASNAVEVSGSFFLDRRPLGDRITRNDGGSWIADGFTVGSLVYVIGSADHDNVTSKIDIVDANYLQLDNDFSRISPEEPYQPLIVGQGWQRLTGINFKDELKFDTVKGLWSVKSNSEIQDEAIDAFDIELTDVTEAWVTEQTPYPERHRNPPEAVAANARIIAVGIGLDPKFGLGNIYEDYDVYGNRIYDQTSGLLENVTASFSASANTITINLPTTASVVDFERAMEVTVTGSASNNKTYTLRGKTVPNILTLIKTETLIDEVSASGVTISGLSTIKGYKEFRNLQNPEAVAQVNWERSMQEGVAVQWFDDVADKRKQYFGPVRTSGIWASGISYVVGDVLFVAQVGYKKFYKCNIDHTSLSDFTADLTKWDEYKAEDVVYPIYPKTQIDS